jgi:glycosyltransferase involved in cell wall biosynthesis
MPPLLFDASHTSHTSAQTGIQRVCRSLFAELEARNEVAPICHDHHMQGWRPLSSGELSILRDRSGGAGKSRGAKWTMAQRYSGRARRWFGLQPRLPDSAGLICPEFFSNRAGAVLPGLLAAVNGPRVAVFYDAIPLKFPEFTPPATVARFSGYLRELLLFDGIAAISEDSAASLRDYWRWLGVKQTPPVLGLPLGTDRPAATGQLPTGSNLPRVLCVCTIEGRKNHLALLDACESLWREGLSFELQLIGIARPETAGAALARIAELQNSGRSLLFNGSVPEADLHAAYRQCSFTVYPSLVEGFGLPVLESLHYGKPCVCAGWGAVGESAHDGGCIPLESVDAASLARALRQLLKNPAELAELSTAARARHLKTWPEYAGEFTAWMHSLPRRNGGAR